MTLTEVSPRIFHNRLPDPAHLYGSVAFCELNRHKCTLGDVRYLILSDSKTRGGIILGRHGNSLHSPFSAPFGALITNRNQRVETVDLMWQKIVEYARERQLGLRVTLPPLFYDPDTTAKSISALHRIGLNCIIDLNYHVDTAHYSPATAASRFRNQLKQAATTGATVTTLPPSPHSIARIYHIVEQNHFAKDRPVRMSLENVIATAPMAGAQFFVVTAQGLDIAGAMVYDAAPGIAQAIYWGDIPGHANLRPMNLLADHLIRHYASLGTKILDLGPSTEMGHPNTGLCAFKESFGAVPSPKYTFTL